MRIELTHSQWCADSQGTPMLKYLTKITSSSTSYELLLDYDEFSTFVKSLTKEDRKMIRLAFPPAFRFYREPKLVELTQRYDQLREIMLQVGDMPLSASGFEALMTLCQCKSMIGKIPESSPSWPIPQVKLQPLSDPETVSVQPAPKGRKKRRRAKSAVRHARRQAKKQSRPRSKSKFLRPALFDTDVGRLLGAPPRSPYPQSPCRLIYVAPDGNHVYVHLSGQKTMRFRPTKPTPRGFPRPPSRIPASQPQPPANPNPPSNTANPRHTLQHSASSVVMLDEASPVVLRESSAGRRSTTWWSFLQWN